MACFPTLEWLFQLFANPLQGFLNILFELLTALRYRQYIIFFSLLVMIYAFFKVMDEEF